MCHRPMGTPHAIPDRRAGNKKPYYDALEKADQAKAAAVVGGALVKAMQSTVEGGNS